MNLLESVTTAWSEIFLHKLRSFLTILGVIFGVGSVISMMSIGAGAERESIRQIEMMGAKNITVKARVLKGKEFNEARRKYSLGLNFDDIDYIEDNVKSIDTSAPQKMINKTVSYGKSRPVSNVVGVNGAFFEVLNRIPFYGRLLIKEDIINFRKVCVLGYEAAKKMFHNEDPSGKIIKIGGVRFVVIGTLPDVNVKSKSVGGSSSINIKSRNLNNDIYIPISIIDKIFPTINRNGFSSSDIDPFYNEIDEIVFKVHSMEQLYGTRELLEKILIRRHKGVEDFEIIIPLEKLEQKKETQRIFNIVMTGIAALSLLVGGIGIMNIMLASVSERTKEIGVRRAIGASRRDIMGQFITESLVLSIIGGLLGIFAGIFISWIVSYKAGWETVITFSSVFLSFGVSALTGVLSGFFPAYRAANMDPVDCLRYE